MATEGYGSFSEPFPWHLGVFDAHCHPTDTVSTIGSIAGMKTRALIIMATRGQDQSIVSDFADKLGVSPDTIAILDSSDSYQKTRGFVLPSFGWHPWFSHQIYDDRLNASVSDRYPNKLDHYRKVMSPSPEGDTLIDILPEPLALSDVLDQTRASLEKFPLALVGEIGLDRAFRIPGTRVVENNNEQNEPLTSGGRGGRQLSPYRINMEHQRMIMRAQLILAGEMQRAVSVHGVAAHGLLFETLRESWHGHERQIISKRQRRRKVSIDTVHKSDHEFEGGFEQEDSRAASRQVFPPRICLHSYSGPVDTLRQYLHPTVPAVIFFSFSTLVNFSHTSDKALDVIKAVPDDRLLAESDLHAAGEKMDSLMEEIIRTICRIKGWSLQHGVKQLASNWKNYAFGVT